MNKNPMNYLITLAGGAILWVITAVVLGGVIGDKVSLSSMSVEEFLARYRIVLAIAALIGITNSLYWFYYGSKDSTAGALERAKKIWNISFIIQIVASAGIVLALVLMLMTQGVAPIYYIMLFGLAALHTFIFFWISTLLMSPTNVERLPLCKR